MNHLHLRFKILHGLINKVPSRKYLTTMGAMASFSMAREYTTNEKENMEKRVLEYKLPNNNLNIEDYDEISIASFNLLAPCYRRLYGQYNSMGRTIRESHSTSSWQARADDTIAFLKEYLLGKSETNKAHSIVALQEFWMEPKYMNHFTDAFSEAGYELHTLKRLGKKRDAVGVLFRNDDFELIASKEVHLVADDRVALLLRLSHKAGHNIVFASTHLTFPHSVFDRRLQLRQVDELHKELMLFCEEQQLGKKCVTIITGDFNVEDQSAVCQHLRNEGFVAAFDVSPPSNIDTEAVAVAVAASSSTSSSSTLTTASTNAPTFTSESLEVNENEAWVSHRTHLEQELGVDHIFVRRPDCSSSGGINANNDIHITSVSNEHNNSNVFITDSAVVPETDNCSTWDHNFTISDHKPVRTTLLVKKNTNDINNYDP